MAEHTIRRRRWMVGVGVIALWTSVGCTAKENVAPELPRPSVGAVPSTTAAVGVVPGQSASAQCPGQVDIVIAEQPVPVGTSVADAVAAGSLRRVSVLPKFRSETAAHPDAVSGIVLVPLSPGSTVLEGSVSGDAAPVAVPADPACMEANPRVREVLIITTDVPRGASLSEVMRSDAGWGEVPFLLGPDDAIVDMMAKGTAVVDIPAGTVATATLFP